MVKVEITYPDKEQEAILFKKKRLDFEALKKAVRPILDAGEAVEIQHYVAKAVGISHPVINYIRQKDAAEPPNRRSGRG